MDESDLCEQLRQCEKDGQEFALRVCVLEKALKATCHALNGITDCKPTVKQMQACGAALELARAALASES